MTKQQYWGGAIPKYIVAVFGMEVGPDMYRAFDTTYGTYGVYRKTYQEAFKDVEILRNVQKQSKV